MDEPSQEGQPGANTIEIVDSIRRNLERILQRLREMDPKASDLALEVVLDQSQYVRNTFLDTLERLDRQSRESGEGMARSSSRVEESLDTALASLTDPETDIANRLHFDVVYRVVFAAGTRGFPMALVC